jgi:hypothetical protein
MLAFVQYYIKRHREKSLVVAAPCKRASDSEGVEGVGGNQFASASSQGFVLLLLACSL